MTSEQRHYLAEGLRHRARYYSGDDRDRGEEYELTLALAGWAAWWRERADAADVRRMRAGTADLFEDAR